MSEDLDRQSVTPESFRRIREVFESALERPPAERQAFVESACAGDTLLIQEVKQMLAAEDQSDRMLDAREPASSGVRTSECPSCKAQIAVSHRFCPFCGTPAESVSRAEGRFRIGALFANRFRIVGLIGRGGMGEVYRAHDLELDQTVALKFLTAVRFDERARSRLRQEVRLARQVTHANVCRVYDIGEAQGELYLSMEYVDGEDLAALLRRIGKLPMDKAIEIALKLCAALAAAHAKGMLHRDLKPANIMIDSSGEVRIMDFGLAAISDELRATQVSEGTPFYMAPEQLAGQKVSAQSDIYALGLVFYEMLTGKPPFIGTTPAELRRLREESRITPPSMLVTDLEPAVERAILRCLDPDPKMRPASAHAVAALLPGGDPLAMALAAGETPSPEIVAAAGSTDPVRPAVAFLLLAGIAVGLVALFVIAPKVQLLNWLSLENPPEVLTAKARDIVRSLGYTERPADEARGYRHEAGYFDYMQGKVIGEEQWRKVLSMYPPPISFWYRQSPAPLAPTEGVDWLGGDPVQRVLPDDPLTAPGMVSLSADMEGRLLRFVAQYQPDHPPSTEEQQTRVPDWSPLFAAAHLDPMRFNPTTSQSVHPTATDSQVAWLGTYQDRPDIPLRVEAASLRGRIVYFEIVPPWNGTGGQDISDRGSIIWSLFVLAVLVCTALLARLNWKTGRADVSGAWRVGLFISATSLLFWASASDHATGTQAFVGLTQTAIPFAVLLGGFSSLCYLAIEPWGRREWPTIMISWSRVLAGRWRDPLVGRDVLIGIIIGVSTSMLRRLVEFNVIRQGGPPAPAPWFPGSSFYLNSLMGPFSAVTGIVASVWGSLLNALFFFAVLLMLTLLLRNKWLAVAALAAFFTIAGPPLNDASAVIISVLSALISLVVTLRFGGLLSIGIANCVFAITAQTFLTTEFSKWYGASSLVALIAIAALALLGFRLSLLRQQPSSVFKNPAVAFR